MKIYLVGGAVRDKLLGREVDEHDWVVVRTTREEMLSRGFKQVGKNFPVFLHPETHEEYALARTERKTAPGYHGFAFHTGENVTLRDDLHRRDLTINALAEDESGHLVDYYGGREDLENRLLRHVSPAFAEDPVRILRTARFAARYASLGFQVAKETRELMRKMVSAGEVDALVPERVWQELQKTLTEATPSVFFQVLRNCGALKVVFPEIDRLFGVPQPVIHHPEIDTGIHTLMALDMAAKLSGSPVARFAALVHDLGKGATPEEEWPAHHRHEARGPDLVRQLCARIRTPGIYRDTAVLAARYHTHVHRVFTLKPATILKTLKALDAFRKPERFENILIVCEADSRGRTGCEEKPYPQADRFRQALQAANKVRARALVEEGLKGADLAERLDRLRVGAIRALGSE